MEECRERGGGEGTTTTTSPPREEIDECLEREGGDEANFTDGRTESSGGQVNDPVRRKLDAIAFDCDRRSDA